jgi:hypothetical protein
MTAERFNSVMVLNVHKHTCWTNLMTIDSTTADEFVAHKERRTDNFGGGRPTISLGIRCISVSNCQCACAMCNM